MENLFAIIVGIGLSAACGFRVFVPLLAMSIAAQTGHLELAAGFQHWMATPTATAALGAATFFEIGSYYIPWLDNMLDTIATPAAIIAGTLVTVSVMPEMPPFIKWSISTIAGGGTAGAVQGLTVLTRAASAATTGGLGNPAVSTVEAGSSILLSLLALLVPVLGLILVVFLLRWAIRKIYRFFKKDKPSPPPPGKIEQYPGKR